MIFARAFFPDAGYTGLLVLQGFALAWSLHGLGFIPLKP